MPSIYESIALGGLAFNDGVNFEIEDGSFTFTPAKKQPQWIDNPDADGSALAYEPNYTNSEFAFSVRILPRLTMDVALSAFGEIQAQLQRAAQLRDKGGLAMPWTPAESSRTYTWYALLGELTDLPITQSGDLAGWFIKAPVIPVKITCRPFGYAAERVVLTPATNATPLQVVELKGVGGDVPAEARAIITDKATLDRRHLEWGIDQDTGPVLITAASLSTAGGTGVVKTRAGAYSAEKVVRGVAVTQPTLLCASGPIANLGAFRIKGRVYVTSAAVRFQASYRSGDGPWKALPAVAPPVINGFAELDLGEAILEEVVAGTQRSEVRVETFTTSGTSEPDVNYMALIPTTSGWGKARGLQSPKPTALLAFDEFVQTAGNLEGKTLGLGGNWTQAVKTGASGFQVDATNHRAVRTTVSDASITAGCYAIAGATNYGATQVAALISSPVGVSAYRRQGLLARYVNPENWLMGVWSGGYLANVGVIGVYKCEGGVVSLLGEIPYIFEIPATPTLITLSAAADGTWRVEYPGYGSLYNKSGQDPALAGGGALASGKPGIYEAWESANAGTRTFDNLNVNGVEQAGRVLYSTRKAEIRADVDDPVQRQDSTGVYYGPPNSYRGGRLEVPTGDSRLVVKLRPNDVDLEADSNVTLSQELEVRIAERVLAPR
jgi:hypothetical protein